MTLYGIIGNPLKHSFSPGYFAEKFAKEGIDAHYEKFELQAIDDFPVLLNNHSNLAGLNVTIPYKCSVIPFLDGMDDVAKEVGAVNCITIKNGRTKGYNTDVTGFSESIRPLLQPLHRKAIILGTGGSSEAVAYVFRTLGIECIRVSRRKERDYITYDELTADMVDEYKLIVNTTPLGMYPHESTYPAIPYEKIGSEHLVYDLIYNPGITKFLSFAQQQHAITKNGLEMLHLQAEASWNTWNS